MKNPSHPILFFGTENFSLITLQKLVENGFSIAAVITKPDTKKGRGHKVIPPAVKVFAQAHDIPVWQPAKLQDITDDIVAIQQPIGVLVSYGKIIPQSIINLFEPGIINVHPSLLPHYRGPSPIETAILNGDKETGVSIMQLAARMDAGPVYLQERVNLNGTETAPELYDQLGATGARLLVSSLPAILDGSLIPTQQDDDTASYCRLIAKQDGMINWRTMNAIDIDRRVRAYNEWPQCRAQLGSIDVIITQSHVDHTATSTQAPGSLILSSAGLSVVTQSGLLAIDTLKPLGKGTMSVDAFLRGYHHLLLL